MKVIQISELYAWIVRSTIKDKQHYFSTHINWVSSPGEATIFKSEEAATQMIRVHLCDFNHMSGEVIEAVPLCGALLNYSAKQKENKNK